MAVARANAERHGVEDRVGFITSAGFERVPPRFRGEIIALVANPPYVAQGERAQMARDVLDWEPADALFPGADPILCYRHIVVDAAAWLAPGGVLAVENGRGQGEDIARLFRSAGMEGVELRTDLSRVDRFVVGRHPAASVSPS